MKQQITRLSPHQNGVVAGVMMAAISLVFVVPMFLLMPGMSGGPSKWLMLLMPVGYLVASYIAMALSSLFYNFVVQFTGGIEYESEATD